QCFLIDQLIRALYDLVTERVYPLANPTQGEKLAIVAVGGYGRGELAPYSDIDLLFLLPYKQTPHTEQVIESLLYFLWDLGLKVGQATRSVAECLRYAKGDLTIRTALLEARYVWGEQALFTELKTRFESEILRGTEAQFVEAKLAERDARHIRVGDSRYQLEPNVKEGKGGLRDLHTLFWIAKYIYQVDDVARLVELGVLSADESARFQRAENFLWTVRTHLHYLAGRAEERLTFNMQTEIGAAMGYTDHAGSRGVERFMKHYFLVAQEHDLDIHPRALRAVTQSLRLIDARLREDPAANRLFVEILTSKKNPEIALRRMNEAGVFGKFIPDFGRVVAQMQYDMYHVYTVDEHTLFAIGILHQIETGQLKGELPVASEIMPTIVSRRALYLATLLHDIAKGRGGDHSELGEKVALKLGPRLGLSVEETET